MGQDPQPWNHTAETRHLLQHKAGAGLDLEGVVTASAPAWERPSRTPQDLPTSGWALVLGYPGDPVHAPEVYRWGPQPPPGGDLGLMCSQAGTLLRQGGHPACRSLGGICP